MQVETTETPYEVRCHECQVTFPVGTRRCVHCGGRIGGGRLRFISDPRAREPRAGEPQAGEPWDIEEHDDEIEAESMPGRSRFLSPFTLMWLVAAVAASVYRACE